MDAPSIITQVSRDDEQLHTFPPAEKGKTEFASGLKKWRKIFVNTSPLNKVVRHLYYFSRYLLDKTKS